MCTRTLLSQTFTRFPLIFMQRIWQSFPSLVYPFLSFNNAKLVNYSTPLSSIRRIRYTRSNRFSGIKCAFEMILQRQRASEEGTFKIRSRVPFESTRLPTYTRLFLALFQCLVRLRICIYDIGYSDITFVYLYNETMLGINRDTDAMNENNIRLTIIVIFVLIN